MAKYFEKDLPVSAPSYDFLIRGLNSNKESVNIKISDIYKIPAATPSALGGIKIGYTEADNNLALKLDSEQAFVTLSNAAIMAGISPAPATSTFYYFRGDKTWALSKTKLSQFTNDLGNYGDFLVAEDIDTLDELNSILTDATLIDTNDSRLSDARVASDVYTWAKEASKPSYDGSEISVDDSAFTNILDSTATDVQTALNMVDGAFAISDTHIPYYDLASKTFKDSPITTEGTDIVINGVINSEVAQGTPPLGIQSTTLVQNLNADLLDGQQGSYYLDYANFDNTPTIGTATITLTTDGGALSVGSTNAFGVNDTTNKTIQFSLDDDLDAIAALTGYYGMLEKTDENEWRIDESIPNTRLRKAHLYNPIPEIETFRDAAIADGQDVSMIGAYEAEYLNPELWGVAVFNSKYFDAAEGVVRLKEFPAYSITQTEIDNWNDLVSGGNPNMTSWAIEDSAGATLAIEDADVLSVVSANANASTELDATTKTLKINVFSNDINVLNGKYLRFYNNTYGGDAIDIIASSDGSLIFFSGSTKIAKLTIDGNLLLKGTVSENQTI